MTDLNSASLADLTAAGIEPAAAVQLALWRPYRGWEDLDLIVELEQTDIARLREVGFTVGPINDEAWPVPTAFKLSAQHG